MGVLTFCGLIMKNGAKGQRTNVRENAQNVQIETPIWIIPQFFNNRCTEYYVGEWNILWHLLLIIAAVDYACCQLVNWMPLPDLGFFRFLEIQIITVLEDNSRP